MFLQTGITHWTVLDCCGAATVGITGTLNLARFLGKSEISAGRNLAIAGTDDEVYVRGVEKSVEGCIGLIETGRARLRAA